MLVSALEKSTLDTLDPLEGVAVRGVGETLANLRPASQAVAYGIARATPGGKEVHGSIVLRSALAGLAAGAVIGLVAARLTK